MSRRRDDREYRDPPMVAYAFTAGLCAGLVIMWMAVMITGGF